MRSFDFASTSTLEMWEPEGARVLIFLLLFIVIAGTLDCGYCRIADQISMVLIGTGLGRAAVGVVCTGRSYRLVISPLHLFSGEIYFA